MTELQKVLKEDSSSLDILIRQMAKFDKAFCDNMAAGTDFVLKLEIKGDKGKMVHCRADSIVFDRPNRGDE